MEERTVVKYYRVILSKKHRTTGKRDVIEQGPVDMIDLPGTVHRTLVDYSDVKSVAWNMQNRTCIVWSRLGDKEDANNGA